MVSAVVAEVGLRSIAIAAPVSVLGDALALSPTRAVRSAAHMTIAIGIAQLKIRFARCVSRAPAMTCAGTIAANTSPHIVVSCRLTCLNCGEDHSCRGTDSRAYCSVNGVTSSDPNAIAARRAAAIARA